MEEEEGGSLPFLDVLVQKETNGSLQTTVYWKPTYTNRYLHFHSNHHPRVKAAVITTLKKRAEDLCNEQDLTREEITLQSFQV